MMARHRGDNPSPREPWYKDERIAGSKHITVRASLRLALIAIAIFALVIGIVAWYLVGQVEELHSLHDNLAHSLASGRAQRLADAAAAEARENSKVAQLACSLVSLVPPGQSAQIDQIRVRYDCTPGASQTPSAVGQPSTSPTTPGGSPTPHSSTSNATKPSPAAIGSAPIPPPSPTPTPSPSSSAPPSPLLNAPSVVCTLEHILGLC
jgi:hypothetical protein